MSQQENFKERFDVYYPMLCRIASGYISDVQECEDIVQDCFIAVWNNGKSNLEEKEFLSYMVRAVKNNCISFLRKKSTEVISLDEEPEMARFAETISEEDSEGLLREERLEKVLSVLPPKCKEIFLMSKLHGLKYQEIASELGISVKTIENQMGKAFKLIREQLKSSKFIIVFILMSIICQKW